MSKLSPYWKAFVGFIAPGAVVLGAAVHEDSLGGHGITTGEWITAVVACVVTSAAVYRVPNRDPLAEHQAESVQPPNAG
jgi:hypothetical protein